jgi:hypothetical protein
LSEITALSVEHLLPDALGCPNELAIENIVCRKCNNNLGFVDRGLISDLEVFAFFAGVRRKGGRPPAIRSLAGIAGGIAKDGPELYINAGPGAIETPYGKIKPSTKSTGLYDVIVDSDRISSSQLNIKFKFDIGKNRNFVRGAYKVGFGFFGFLVGFEECFKPRFDQIRKFVVSGVGSFRLIVRQSEIIDSAIHSKLIRYDNECVHLDFALFGLQFTLDLDRRQSAIQQEADRLRSGSSPVGFSLLPLIHSDE